MKRVFVALTVVSCFLIGTVAFAAAVGVPEIDEANATLSLTSRTAFVPTQCPGEDGISYITFRGTWTGTETETTPGFTDYNLSGPIRVAGVVWTINQKTFRGVLTGAITLSSAAAGVRTYSGRLTLITQGVPAAGAVVPGRGWISAPTFTNSAIDGGSLLANVEFKINGGTFAANAAFGDAAPFAGIPNFSVTTANKTC
jgi:hypothetical protein